MRSIKDFKERLLNLLLEHYPGEVNIRFLINEYADKKPDETSEKTRDKVREILLNLSRDAP